MIQIIVFYKKILLQILIKKIEELHRAVNKIVNLLERKRFTEAFVLIDKIYFEINSINIYITNLSNYDLNMAITEKKRDPKSF